MLLCPPKLKQTKADKDSFIYYMFIYVLDSILLCYVHILDSMILDSSCFVIPKHSIESVSLSTHTHESHEELPLKLWSFNGGFSCKSLSKLNNSFKEMQTAMNDQNQDIYEVD